MRFFSRYYALAAVTGVYTLNLVDRGLVGLFAQAMKQDLALSDTQLGLLTGIAFGLFYATLGVPIARWSDRGDRVGITALCLSLWGITMVATSFVTSFAHLAAARVAAAFGEAGCKPPTYSLVGDYFPAPAERTRALAIYLAGNPIHAFIAYLVGGWLYARYGWRSTFLIMGVIGLAVALLVRLTLADPRRAIAASGEVGPAAPSLPSVLRILWRRRACRQLCIGLVLLYIMGLGLGPWYAAFLIRSHAMATSEVGTVLGLVFGIGGIAGLLLGGEIASRWLSRSERLQMRVVALATASLVPAYIVFLLAPDRSIALAGLGLLILIFNLLLPTPYAMMQRLVADDMRATLMAVIMFLANLIGMGVGPLLVGALSDTLTPSQGPEALRYAMLALSFVALWAAIHFWKVADTVAADLEDAATDNLAEGLPVPAAGPGPLLPAAAVSTASPQPAKGA